MRLLLFFLASISVTNAVECVQCASTYFMENWLMTTFKAPPAGFIFNDNDCSGANGDADNGYKSKDCPKSCFNYQLSINGTAAFIRGCHSDFAPDDLAVGVSTTTCTYDDSDGSAIYPVGTRNRALHGFESEDKGCTLVTQKYECIRCGKYGGSGTCSSTTTSKSTSKGPICVKTTGKINGYYYEERDVAYLPPYPLDTLKDYKKCIYAPKTETDYKLGGGKEQRTQRTKRELVQTLNEGTTCYCVGDNCNPATQIAALASTMLLMALASFL